MSVDLNKDLFPLARIDLKICIHTTNLTESCAKNCNLKTNTNSTLIFNMKCIAFEFNFAENVSSQANFFFSACISFSCPYLNIFNDQSCWMEVTSEESSATKDIFIWPMTGLSMALTSSVITAIKMKFVIY